MADKPNSDRCSELSTNANAPAKNLTSNHKAFYNLLEERNPQGSLNHIATTVTIGVIKSALSTTLGYG